MTLLRKALFHVIFTTGPRTALFVYCISFVKFENLKVSSNFKFFVQVLLEIKLKPKLIQNTLATNT